MPPDDARAGSGRPDEPGGESPEGERYDAYVGRVARGAGLGSFGQGVHRLLNYATQVALARMYGPAQLGFYVLGSTTLYLTNVLAQVGMDNGVVRFVARYRADGDAGRVRGTVLLALLATLASSTALGAGIFLGAPFLGGAVFGEPYLTGVFRVFAVALPLFTLMNMTLYATEGFGSVRYTTSVRQIVQPSANLVLIVVFYLLGARVLGAAVAYVLSVALGLALSLYYLKRVFPEIAGKGVPAVFEPRPLFGTSAPMIVANVMPYVNTWTALAVLGAFGSAAQVGVFNAAARTGTLSALVLFAFSGIFSPMVSTMYREGSLEHLRSLYGDISRWAFTGSLAIFLLTVLLSADIMAVFGEGFAAGIPAMVVIAVAQLFSSSVGLTARVLAMTGRQKTVMVATAGSTVLGVAVTAALVPAYGVLGAAAATAVAIISSNVVTLVSVRRSLGFWPYDARYLKPAAAGAVAVAALFGLKLLSPLPPGIPTILAFAPLFAAAYLALLLALGLGPSDRQLLGSLWTAVRRKTAGGSPGGSS